MRNRSSLIAKSIGALSVLVALLAWALASPVGASPDEDYHLVSSWCGQGLRDGVCEAGVDSTNRRVPAVLLTSTCYAAKPEASAQCQGSLFADSDDTLSITARGNFSGDYPPVFYFFTSMFVGADFSVSVIAMRIANALLFVGLIALTYMASPPGFRRPLLAGIMVTVVPLGMFLIPSINPSGWAMLSAATLLVSVLGYITTEERRRRLFLGVLAGISLVIGAGARADAAIYSVVAIGAAAILTVRPGWIHIRRMIYPAILAVAAGVSFLSSGQSSALESAAQVEPFTLGHLADLLMGVPTLWIGGLGSWGLGWLDTYMPNMVWVFAGGIYAAILFTAIAGANRRRGLAIAGVALVTWLVPTYVQYVSGMPVGSGVQPRYILPLLTLLAVTAMVRLDGKAFQLTPGQRWITVMALAAANGAALHVNIRRYVTGADAPSLNLNANLEWWWGLPVSPLAVWAIGSIAFAVGLVLLSREFTHEAPALGQADRPGVAPRAAARIPDTGDQDLDRFEAPVRARKP